MQRSPRCCDTTASQRGDPAQITVDNGTEFFSRALDHWAYRHSVKLDFIRPGRPMEDGFIELWLPRDSEIDLSIQAGALAGGQRVTTYATSDTCIAQIRLQ